MAMEEEQHRQEPSSCVEIPVAPPRSWERRGIEQSWVGEALTEVRRWEAAFQASFTWNMTGSHCRAWA